VQTHVKVLGWLHIAIGGLHLLSAILVWMLFMGGSAAIAATDASATGFAAFVAGLGTIIVGFMAALSLPQVIIGWGMVNRAAWARVWGIVLSIIALFMPPFGTALGIYGLVVLFNQETIDAFEGRRAWTN
jgi:hypothetical protein